jgi:outer membrane murein-binding lipoprotein Lpp
MSILNTTRTIDELIEKVSELESENAGLIDDLRGLRNRLAAAEEKRDTAQAALSYHQIHYPTQTRW